MELADIIDRYAEGLEAVDTTTTIRRVNQRTKEPYLPGLKTLSEVQAVDSLDAWWAETHLTDFVTPDAHHTQIPYPGTKTACDHVITTVGQEDDPEWAIEAKFLQLVGDNGKRNDFAVGKAISPYLKDRSLYHDVHKLREIPVARRLAVIGFSFTYDLETCARALELHPTESERISNIRDVCESNEGALSVRPIVEFADGIFKIRDLVVKEYVSAEFEGWRHPCGGRGVVFGWEVKRPGQSTHSGAW